MRLLVFAPHPDDEIIGCGGLLRNLCLRQESVRIIIVTRGEEGGDPEVRATEAQAGLEALGAPPPECWGYPDGGLPLDTGIRSRYREIVSTWHPTHIALPAPGETHPDHRRLTRGLLDALSGGWQGELLFYETTTPMPTCNQHHPIDLEKKLAALTCHASQQARFDYAGHARGLAVMRGAMLGLPAAEAFLSYLWDGSPQNFFEQRPLVSILMRAADPDFVMLAIESLRVQEYDHFEIVLVWHGEGPPPDDRIAPDLALQILRGPGPRSANLNAGLAAARGYYVAFLDQDDIFHPGHLSTLLTELHGDPALDIAYADYRLVTCRRDDAKVEIISTKPVRVEDYRPGRLLAGNFIPLNTFMCQLRLARRIGFDETLDAYEDWDFLARAELAGACFRHIEAQVADYRLYPVDMGKADLENEHARKGFSAWASTVKNKLLAQLDPLAFDNLTCLVGSLENERNLARERLVETEKSLQAERQAAAELRRNARDTTDWADLLVPGIVGHTACTRLAAHAWGNDGPCFAVLLPVCDPVPEHLIEAVHSVEQQLYPNWRLCIADDGSTHPAVLHLLETLEDRARMDARYRVIRRPERGGIVAATTSAQTLAGIAETGESPLWLTFLDHDDRLAPEALLEAAAAIRRQPHLNAIYTDSRMIDCNGNLLHEYRKPAWSPETLLHLNYINHLTLVRADLYEAVGSLRPGFDGSQDWDLWLRLSRHPELAVTRIEKPLYDWRASETSLAYSMGNKPYALAAASRALADHLAVCGIPGVEAVPATAATGYLLHWNAKLRPLTAIVPTHRNPNDLARLIDGLATSDYPALQVIFVANRVTDTATHELLARAARRPHWRVLEDDRPFNWAALNNAAVRHAETEWLLFLNDDIELPTPDVLPRLARYLTLSTEIGAVGARLEYAQEQGGGIQHDGIDTDSVWVARNLGDAQRRECTLGVPRNISAVTGACLLTPRPVFDRCGGFEERLAVAYNDVDYCLHVRTLGLRVVQASDVCLIHRESRTRGGLSTETARQQYQEEVRLMREKWKSLLDETYRLTYLRRHAGSRILKISDE